MLLGALALVVFNSENYRVTMVAASLALVALVMQVSIISLKSLLVLHPDIFFLIYLPPIVVLTAVLLLIKLKESFV